MDKYNKLPIYEAVLDGENTGMYAISFVDAPAVNINWMAYSEMKENLKFSVENEEERMVLGVVMLADTPIYRRDEEGREFYVVYKPKTLEMMAEKYLKDGFQNSVDLNHDGQYIGGAKMVELFIKNKERGIDPVGFDVNDGSLFARFHVEDDNLWSEIKNGTFNGFSLAGFFGVEYKHKKQYKMSKLAKLRALLKDVLVQFQQVSTDKGILSYVSEGEMPEVGDEVSLLDEQGNDIPAEDGEYTLENGAIVVVADGKVVEIKPAPEQKGGPVEESPAPSESEAVPTEMEKKKVCGEEEVPVEEVVPVVDEKDARISELEAEIAEKVAEIEENKAEIEKLKARIKELEDAPASAPIQEEFERVVEGETSSDKKINNLRKVFGAK